MKMFRFLPCLASGVLITALSASATPYASECTVSNGTVSYYLNESPGTVTVTLGDGSHPALTPATPAVGVNSFPLTGTNTKYSITVFKIGAGTPVQLSADTNQFSVWNSPRGVDINANPKHSSWFGRIYVANSAVGGTAPNNKGLGLYALNADQSSLAGGTNGMAKGVFSPNGSSSSPYRLGVGAQDNNIYVGDLTSTGATVWQFDPNFTAYTNQVLGGLGVTAGEAIGVHGEIFGAPRALGSLANSNLVLYTTDYDMASGTDNASTTYGYGTGPGDYNNINQYLIGSSMLPWTNPPNLCINAQIPSIATLDEEVDIGAVTGNIYLANYRLNYAAPNLEIFDPTGMNLLFSSQNGNSDYFNPASSSTYSSYSNGVTLAAGAVATVYGSENFAPFSMKVSPDEQFVACGLVNNPIYIMPLSNGIPNPNNLEIIPNYPNTGSYEDLRALSWDAGDNVYTVSSGQGLLRIFSLGLTTTATTTGDTTGTNGTFSLTTPDVQASVVATTPIAYQANNSYTGLPTAVPGVFTISLNAAQTVPVNITFTLGGTGTNGVNYTTTATNVITFPAGTTTETVTITPTANPVSGPTFTVTLSLQSGAAYSAVAPASDTVYIANSGPQELVFSANPAPTMYRGNSNDFASFTVARWGDTNTNSWTIPTTAFHLAGTAVFGTDYLAGPQPQSYTTAATAGTGSGITVNQGDTSETIEVGLPQLHTNYTGSLTIVVGGVAGSSPEGVPFTFASGTTTLTLLDNLNPPEFVLWSDPLTNTASSNWTLTFGNSNTTTVVLTNYNYTPSTDPNYPGTGTGVDDFDVEFGYSVANDGVGQSLYMTAMGWTNALKMTVNKVSGGIPNSPSGASAGANVYPQGQHFYGNYALRFSMNLTEGTLNTTEFDTFGINHYGTNCNWFGEDVNTNHFGTTNEDGLWFWVDADTDGAGAALGCVGVTGQPLPNTGFSPTIPFEDSTLALANVFKSPVVYDASPPGAPSDGVGNFAPTWSDVEVKQVSNVVTLTINKTVIASYPNATIFTNGDIMLGYDDPYASVGSSANTGVNPGAAVYYSNVRVVELGPDITNQPVSVSVGAGSNATFSVGALGTAPFTNKWYFGTNLVQTDVKSSLPLNDTDTYTISPVAVSNGGTYTVVVSDGSGSITSAPVTLTVGLYPAITSSGVTFTTNQDVNVTMAESYTGTAPVTFTWKLNGVTLTNGAIVTHSGATVAGATTNTLVITDIQPVDSGNYTFTVANAYGTSGTITNKVTVIAGTSPTFGTPSLVSGKLVLPFTTTDIYDTTNSFNLRSATNLLGPWTTVTGTWATNGSGGFTVSVTPTGTAEFLVLQRK